MIRLGVDGGAAYEAFDPLALGPFAFYLPLGCLRLEGHGRYNAAATELLQRLAGGPCPPVYGDAVFVGWYEQNPCATWRLVTREAR